MGTTQTRRAYAFETLRMERIINENDNKKHKVKFIKRFTGFFKRKFRDSQM